MFVCTHVIIIALTVGTELNESDFPAKDHMDAMGLPMLTSCIKDNQHELQILSLLQCRGWYTLKKVNLVAVELSQFVTECKGLRGSQDSSHKCKNNRA